jgi:aminoglycoside phosphotransferase (APT) family kinase protein
MDTDDFPQRSDAATPHGSAVAPSSMKDELLRWIEDELGTPVEIAHLERTSAGLSRENWTFEAVWAGTTHPLIARRDPKGSVLATDRAIETAVLLALTQTVVPAPILRWADLDGQRLGRPCLIMDLAPGTCDSFVLNGDRPLEERVAIAERIYDELAKIHAVPWEVLGLGDHMKDPGRGAGAAAADHWEAELRRVQLDPEPELAFVLAWLRERAPRNARTTLVHGDFKPGNLLLDGIGNVTAVLDWETAHLGDPHEDLGWVTNPLRAREHRIAGVWEPADLLDRWSSATGFELDPEALQWWQVLANLKLAVIVLTGIHAFSQGRLDRVYQAPVALYRMLLSQIEAP